MATGRVPTTANSPLTAKGDLFTYSTAPARLAVGNNGESLVADSSTSTGLRYTAGTVQINPVLNSAMQCWQRGTSFTTNSTYTADRWYYVSASNNATISRQTTGDTTNLPFIQYCARVQRNSGSTAIGDISLTQSMESINSIPFAGKTITLSFYARVGANYSGGASGFISQVRSGTGTDQNLAAGYTGSNSFISNTQSLTTTWTRYSYTGTVPTTATEIGIYTGYTPSGTAGANDYYEVTGVQIDIGNVALPFRTNGATLQGELAACQRYYERFADTTSINARFGNGQAESTTKIKILCQFKVRKRTTISAIDYSGVTPTDEVTNPTLSSITLNAGGLDVADILCTVTGATQYRPYILYASTAGGYIGFSAEL